MALLLAMAAAVIGAHNTGDGQKIVLPPAEWLYPDDPALQAKGSFFMLCGLSLIAAVADLQIRLRRDRQAPPAKPDRVDRSDRPGRRPR